MYSCVMSNCSMWELVVNMSRRCDNAIVVWRQPIGNQMTITFAKCGWWAKVLIVVYSFGIKCTWWGFNFLFRRIWKHVIEPTIGLFRIVHDIFTWMLILDSDVLLVPSLRGLRDAHVIVTMQLMSDILVWWSCYWIPFCFLMVVKDLVLQMASFLGWIGGLCFGKSTWLVIYHLQCIWYWK